MELVSMITDGPLGYLVIFLFTIAGAFGSPVPEDVAVITSGFLYYTGQFSLVGALLVGIVGVLSGDVVVYTYGRFFYVISDGRHPRLRRFIDYMIGCGTREKFERLFERHGNKMIFGARFVPGLRFATFFSAGAAGTRLPVFFFYDSLASLISVPVWLWLGWYFGEDLASLIKKIETTEAALTKLLLTLGILLVIWLVTKRVMQHFRQSSCPGCAPSSSNTHAGSPGEAPSHCRSTPVSPKPVNHLPHNKGGRTKGSGRSHKGAVVRLGAQDEEESSGDRMVS